MWALAKHRYPLSWAMLTALEQTKWSNMRTPWYFDHLDVTFPGCTKMDVKKAYRQQAVKCHPDKVDRDRVEEATASFRLLYEAYELALNHLELHGHGHESGSCSDASSQPSSAPSSTKKSESMAANFSLTIMTACSP